MYRWHLNSFQMSANPGCPGRRWKAMSTDVLPWQKNGRHIVIAAPRTYAKFHQCESWIADTIDALARVTDRQLVIRDKESKRSLQSDFDGAHCLVTHASIAAVEAVIMGCPVFVHPDSAAALVGRTDLAQVEKPAYPDRQPWLNSLAYSQWNETGTDGRHAMADDRQLNPHPLRSIFAKPKTTPPENLYREIALYQAAEDIAKPRARPMTITGYEPGAISAKLATIKQRAQMRRADAFGMQALVIGCSANVWAEVEQAMRLCEFDAVYCVKLAGVHWVGGRFTWCSLHPEFMDDYERQRSDLKLHSDYEIVAPLPGELGMHGAKGNISRRVSYRYQGMDSSASSGGYAAKVALDDGFDRVVLAGVPMDGGFLALHARQAVVTAR
jgi:hypothetical protein